MARTMNGRNFTNFNFENNSSVSDELTLDTHDQFTFIGFIPTDDWVTADIIVEVQYGNDDTNWRQLRDSDGVIATTTPSVDTLTLAPDNLAKALSLPVKKMRLVSVTTGTTTPVNQSPATRVQAHFR